MRVDRWLSRISRSLRGHGPGGRLAPGAVGLAALVLAPLAVGAGGHDNGSNALRSGVSGDGPASDLPAPPRPGPASGRLVVVNKSGHSLSVLDPASGKELASVPTGRSPHEVDVSPDGRFAYVTDYGSGDAPGHTVTVVDLQEPGVEKTLDLSPHLRPHGIDVASDGTFWVTTEGSRHVLHVDPESGEILQAVETGQEVTHMVAVAEAAGRLYTANIGSGSVTVVDASAG